MHIIVSLAIALLAATTLVAQTPQPVQVPADSARWMLDGRAQVTDYLGKRSLMLDGGIAVIRDYVFEDGVIDMDVATPAKRGFFGFQFRFDSANGEFVYLRQHKSGAPDAMQYTPVLNGGLNWQIFSGPGFIGSVEIPRDTWFHLRLVVSGSQAKLFVGDTVTPALVIPDLKSGVKKGQVGLAVLVGATYFSNVQVRSTPPSERRREAPAMPTGILTDWRLSPAYDALARDLERPLGTQELASIPWQRVTAEPPGHVVIGRYRQPPILRVTFQTDFATRLDPQPGMKMVYARTTIQSDRDEIRKLSLGYSDDVTVFLNGRPLFRGRSAQSFRDPAFLGIIDLENDAVYLPLERGANELVLALSEVGGGWGFIARLGERAK